METEDKSKEEKQKEPTMKDYKKLQEEIHKINELMEQTREEIKNLEKQNGKSKVKDKLLDFDLECFQSLLYNMEMSINNKDYEAKNILERIKKKRKENKK